jgi:hypothetical protein
MSFPVGVQWDFGAIEHHQQLGVVGMEPREQAVEGDEACRAPEDAVELLWGAKWLSMGFVVDNHRLWPLCYDRH